MIEKIGNFIADSAELIFTAVAMFVMVSVPLLLVIAIVLAFKLALQNLLF